MSHWKHKIEGVDWAEMKLAEREMIFQSVVKNAGHSFDQPPFAILWEDPDDLDAPAKVTTPSPVWWAMALHGGMLPPVEVYWALAHDEAQPGFTRHHRGHLLHDTPPMRALTPEEAMEYLVMKDLPPSVWRDYQGNRTILKVVPRELIPTNREHRNAWRIAQAETKEAA
jgi:hypothetical protein